MAADPAGSPPIRTAFWIMVTGAGQVIKMLVTIGSTIILARLLLPRDFGLVATAAPIMGFAELLRDAGFSQAFVQRADVTEQQAHGLFWLTIAITAVLSGSVMLISPIAATIFHEPRLTGVLIAFATIMLFNSLGSQPAAWLTRHLRFQALSVIDVLAGVTNLVAATVVALLAHSYWALIAGSAAAAIMNSGLSLWVSGWRPGRPYFDRAVWQMARFGAGVSFSNIMNFVSRNVDNLMIARAYGPVELGYYDRAYKLMLMPLTQITWPISRVLTPVLSRLRDDPRQYAATYLATITFIMAGAQPALITATVLAKPTVLVLLGAKWAPAIPIFQWLSAAAVHQVVTSSHGWLYLSQGRVRHYAIVGVYGSITTVAAFVVGLHWGAVGVAAAYAITDYTLRFPFAWLYAGREGPVTTPMLWGSMAPHLLAAAGSVGALMLFQHGTDPNSFLDLVVGAIIAYAANFAVLALFPAKRARLLDGAAKLRAKLLRR